MTWLLVIISVFWILFRLGMAKTFIVVGGTILTAVMWLFGFLVGGFVTAIFQPDAFQLIRDISPSFLKNHELMESVPILMLMLSAPFIFVVDLLWWSVEISIFHGTISLWLVELVTLYYISYFWLYQIVNYMEVKRGIYYYD